MEKHSLLAQLATRFSTHPENLATESLVYILRGSQAARRGLLSFVRHLGVTVPELVSFRSQEGSSEGSIPDLVGRDSNGNEVLIIEAKFWAGLTDSQPVAYLNRLPEPREAILVFVAPAQRLTILWGELISRCRDAHLVLGPEAQISAEVKCRRIGGHHSLSLVSWRALLSHLLNTLNAEGDSITISNVLQLQGLCDRMDDDAFLPIRSEELTSATASRYIQFCRLVDDVASRLISEGIVSVSGLKTSAGAGSYYRPMKIHCFGCYLHVNSEQWARRAYTPIWFSVQDQDWKLTQSVRDALLPLELEDPTRVQEGNNELLIPLRIPLGVERPIVFESLLAQVCEIAGLLAGYGVQNKDA